MAVKLCPGATKRRAHVVDTTEFSRDASRADNLAPYCKVCAAAKQREWKHANPEKVRAMKAAYKRKDA